MSAQPDQREPRDHRDRALDRQGTVRDAVAKARLAEIISTHLADHRQAWELQPDGEYRRRTIPEGTPEDSPVALGTFETLIRAAAAEA